MGYDLDDIIIEFLGVFMDTKVDILLVGDVKYENHNYHCWPTIVLIQEKEKKIIVDPGAVADQKIISDSLQRLNLSVDDISHVFITHSHLDHYRNVGMFARAEVIDYWGCWRGDCLLSNEWTTDEEFTKGNFSENIQVIKTPGHDYSSLSFLVRGEVECNHKKCEGIIGICGDIFWREDYPDLNDLEDQTYVTDKKSLIQSRKTLLNNTNYIIPGHGNIFRAKEE